MVKLHPSTHLMGKYLLVESTLPWICWTLMKSYHSICHLSWYPACYYPSLSTRSFLLLAIHWSAQSRRCRLISLPSAWPSSRILWPRWVLRHDTHTPTCRTPGLLVWELLFRFRVQATSHRMRAGPWVWRDFHGKVYAFVPIRWVYYDQRGVHASMDILKDMSDPWVPCNAFSPTASGSLAPANRTH